MEAGRGSGHDDFALTERVKKTTQGVNSTHPARLGAVFPENLLGERLMLLPEA